MRRHKKHHHYTAILSMGVAMIGLIMVKSYTGNMVFDGIGRGFVPIGVVIGVLVAAIIFIEGSVIHNEHPFGKYSKNIKRK